MADPSPDTETSIGRRRRRGIAIDVVLILCAGLVAEAAYFAPKQGRAMFTGDSMQHVDSAEAILDGDRQPYFAFRKPGYSYILAGLGWATGNMSWSAIVANHFFLALLPVAAYGISRKLLNRTAGWIAAILLIARLQTALYGNRIMSEASYALFLSFGVLAFLHALSTKREYRWMATAGALMVCAWLIRAVGVALIGSGAIVLLIVYRRAPRKALLGLACLSFPLACGALLECYINHDTTGHFRTTTGGLGMVMQTRARYFQGSDWSDDEKTEWFLGLLPERTREQAFAVNRLDGCVARARALRGGMDEWTFNQLAKDSALKMYWAQPLKFAKAFATITTRHLLRRRLGPAASSTHPTKEARIIVHNDLRAGIDPQEHWYAYWFLPERSIDESTGLVARMKHAATMRAPFGRGGAFPTLLVLGGTPIVCDVLSVIRSVAFLWPGFALILCGMLGLNRKACAFLALAYLLDAGIVGAFGSTDTDNERYQFVWLATDTALVACLVAPLLTSAVAYFESLWRRDRAGDRRLTYLTSAK